MGINPHNTELGKRPGHGDCGALFMPLVEFNQLREIDIRDPVTVSSKKIILFDELADFPDPASGIGILTGFGEVYAPFTWP
jgi:hypothetical protein